MSLSDDVDMHDMPPAVRASLETLVARDCEPEQLGFWYRTIWEQHFVQEQQAPYHNTADLEALSPEGRNAHIMYGCPRCSVTLKQAKDYIRHAKQTCYALEIFRCPDCPKTFTRKHRFTKHHKARHPGRCSAGNCTHQEQALETLPDKAALGCGFCGNLYESGLHAYLRHLIVDHFRQGATLAEWSTDRQLLALLSHAHVHKEWNDIISSSFPNGFDRPQYQWSVDLAKEAISVLESAPSGGQLTAMLWRLLTALGAPQINIDMQTGDAPFNALLSAFPIQTHSMAGQLGLDSRPASALSTCQTLQGTPVINTYDNFTANTNAYAADLDYGQPVMESELNHSAICSSGPANVDAMSDELYFAESNNTCFNAMGAHFSMEPEYVEEDIAKSVDYFSSNAAPWTDNSALFDASGLQLMAISNPTPPLPPLDMPQKRRSSRLSRAFSILSPIRTSE